MYYSDNEKKMFEIWDVMLEYGVVTEEEISVACYFGGRTLKTFQSLLYFKTGCRNLEQFFDEEE